ncbi:MAG TPA: hypothetical protein VNA19_09910 [Pyrinomonadaceae bacterium]|nr:hypothetical protein [Pyrinomonadaceae bacterium]
MRSSSTAEFRKTRTCPSAETLLLYHTESLMRPKQRRVTAHLETCDFCGAEIQLLARHAPAGVYGSLPEASPMPLPLRRLAEDLLTTPTRVLASFLEATFERERLTLTDA